jgi:hypothetical protein
MPSSYKKLQEKITFDALAQTLSAEFAKTPDRRRTNASYKLTDFLCSAFAMFSLKSPSLLAFEEQTKIERRNLHSIYHIGARPG